MGLKIVHLNRFGHVVGGTEGYMVGVSRALQLRGHQAVIGHGVPVPAHEVEDGIPRVLLHRLAHRDPPRDTLGVAEAIAAIELLDPDLVFCHEVFDSHLLRMLIPRWPMVRFIHAVRTTCPSGIRWWDNVGSLCNQPLGATCQVHAYLHRCMPRNPFIGIPLIYRYGQLLDSLRHRVPVVVASHYMRTVLLRNGFSSDQVSVIPYFIDESEPLACRDGPAGSRPFTMLFIGRLTQEKGAGLLLPVLQLGPKGARLIIIGDGDLRGSIEADVRRNGLQDRVLMLGWMDTASVYRTLAQADVLLFPSLTAEGFGIVGLEAMAAGVPAIAFPCGGVEEWLADGTTGMLVHNRTPVALAAAIHSLAADPERRRQMGDEGRKIVQERFRPEHHLDRLLPLFERTIAGFKPESTSADGRMDLAPHALTRESADD